MSEHDEINRYFNGQLLLAMPRMSDRRFVRSIILLCVHNKDGAMGLMINRWIDNLTYEELFQQLGIEPVSRTLDQRVYFGGPVETSRGFVLHSTDHVEDASILVDDDIAVSSTTDILRAIAAGEGPKQSLLALGYAAWGPGQLDAELHANAWLTVPPDDALLFDHDLDTKWHRAIAKIGIDVNMLSAEAGHA